MTVGMRAVEKYDAKPSFGGNQASNFVEVWGEELDLIGNFQNKIKKIDYLSNY